MTARRSSPRIWLVRHAETDWSGVRYCGRTDLPLAPGGVARAAALAAVLAGELPACAPVVASPLRRAAATAAAIATAAMETIVAAPGATFGPVRFDHRWVEVNMGDIEGCTFAEVEARWPEIAAALASGSLPAAWPGGETDVDVSARVSAAWADVACEAAAAGSVVVVAHGMVLRRALSLAGVTAMSTPFAPAEAIALEAEGSGWRLARRWRV